MKKNNLWIRTGIIVAVTLLGIYLVFGPRRAPNAGDFTWTGIKANLAENINLGLDLKGGSHLVMRVKTDEYLKTLAESNAQAAMTAVSDAKLPVTGSTVVAENGTYSFALAVSDANQAQAVIDKVKEKIGLEDWTLANNGSTVSWTLPSTIQTILKQQAVEQALKVVESRIDMFGVQEPTLQRHGSESSAQILLQMPGVDDPERIKDILNAESRLMLMKVTGGPSPQSFDRFPTEQAAVQSLGGAIPANRRVLPYTDKPPAGSTAEEAPTKEWVIVEYPPVIDGSELRTASAVSRTGNDSDYQINFALKPLGAQKFGDWTGRNINNYMGVVLGSELGDEVKSIAFIKSQIFDSGEISGNFLKKDADDLALTLRSGALPAKIEYLEERTVGPSLGADSIRAGVTASLAGMIFIVIFMLIYYRGSGVNAVIALILNMLLTLAGLILMKSTLTLPGIAGFILGLGMAVDSNVLIFERMREELRAGRDVATAVKTGFDRAFITIIDTHVTTIVSTVILYLFGSGPIRGFAITLTLALLVNLFSAVFVSRTIFLWLLDRNPEMKKISI